MKPLVSIKHLHKSYGAHTVFENFNLSVEQGQVVGLIGETGIGKTTLLRCLCALEESSGHITISGTLGYMFQEHRLFPWRTIKENILLPFHLMQKSPNMYFFNDLVSLAHIADQTEKYPPQLSGGQKQRAALVRTLITDPDILLLDEPLNHLNRDLANSLLEALLSFTRKSNKTMIISSHDPWVIPHMDFVVNLDRKEDYDR